jgi:hypothetical protein
MPNCVLAQPDLSRRGKKVSELLRPLVGKPSGPARASFSEAGTFIIATYTGNKPATRPYRDWRFATFVPNFYGMYFERWDPVDSKHQLWALNRAYLSLFRLQRITQEEHEIIALHCDPNEEDRTHLIYKQGPHLHFTSAEQPLPHAHIALNLSNVSALLESVDAMTIAISQAIEMLSLQVLTLYSAPTTLPT